MKNSRAFLAAICVNFIWAAGVAYNASKADAASFDCARVSAPDEVTVCVNPKLSADDEALNMGFIRARQYEHDLAINIGKSFIRKRRACGVDVACIDAAQSSAGVAYASIIRAHETPVASSAPAPTQTVGGSGLSQRTARNLTVRIVNNTRNEIIALFASPTTNDKWHSNIIPNGQALAPGRWIDANFDDGSGNCVYDLRVVDVAGNAAVRQAENVSTMTTWTLHD